MSSVNQSITVIIPTIGSKARKKCLLHAIDSVVDQSDVTVEPLIVLNGSSYDNDTRDVLEKKKYLKVKYVKKGSLPLALAYGRASVESPYFCFLDDDDEYLPGALWKRISVLEDNPKLDVVVTNGVKRWGEKEKLLHESMCEYNEDPLKSLLSQGNWLASCGGLFRTSSINLEYFDPEQKYFEWTLVAFKLAYYKMTIRFLEDKTFIIHDSKDSLSKENENHEYESLFYNRLTSYELPIELQAILKKKRMDALHKAAEFYCMRGNKKLAWKKHLASLSSTSSFRDYVLFTRKLF